MFARGPLLRSAGHIEFGRGRGSPGIMAPKPGARLGEPCPFALRHCCVRTGPRLYYRRRFGVVRSKRRGGPYAWLLIVGGIGGLAAFFAAAYVDGALAIQPVASYPVSLVCLFWALFYLACYLHPYRLRPHSLWFAALFFGLCFLTMVGVVPKSQFFEGSGRPGDILIWLAFSLHGLLDHLLLLRLLPKASTEPATSQSTSQSVARYD
jgi:hypothetical protein